MKSGVTIDQVNDVKDAQCSSDRSKAVVLLCFSVACFGDRVSVTFYLMFFHIFFSSVWVAEWPPFGKELHTRLTICFHCILTICNFS